MQNLVRCSSPITSSDLCLYGKQEASNEAGAGVAEAMPQKRLRNQFNFSERGVQTAYFPPKERGTGTDLPENDESSGSCSQWEIYDAYIADQKLQRQQANLPR